MSTSRVFENLAGATHRKPIRLGGDQLGLRRNRG